MSNKITSLLGLQNALQNKFPELDIRLVRVERSEWIEVGNEAWGDIIIRMTFDPEKPIFAVVAAGTPRAIETEEQLPTAAQEFLKQTRAFLPQFQELKTVVMTVSKSKSPQK